MTPNYYFKGFTPDPKRSTTNPIWIQPFIVSYSRMGLSGRMLNDYIAKYIFKTSYYITIHIEIF
jgi:hypothetical protein